MTCEAVTVEDPGGAARRYEYISIAVQGSTRQSEGISGEARGEETCFWQAAKSNAAAAAMKNSTFFIGGALKVKPGILGIHHIVFVAGRQQGLENPGLELKAIRGLVYIMHTDFSKIVFFLQKKYLCAK